MSLPAAPSPVSAACFNHPAREAAARCVGCGRPFCRECVTPVDRRMFCAACYKEKTGIVARPAADWFVFSVAGQAVLGLLGLWFTAYFLGKVLLELPSSFHEGTVWLKFMP
ncbi:MAG: rhomboid family protein [Verrucomicrobiaceae bacterium]|nr:rhomboid family protein [Verrucomicrobiaceae bacterium]